MNDWTIDHMIANNLFCNICIALYPQVGRLFSGMTVALHIANSGSMATVGLNLTQLLPRGVGEYGHAMGDCSCVLLLRIFLLLSFLVFSMFDDIGTRSCLLLNLLVVIYQAVTSPSKRVTPGNALTRTATGNTMVRSVFTTTVTRNERKRDNPNFLSLDLGTNVHQWDNPQHPATQWLIRSAGRFDPSRRYVIESKNARGKYLNVAGASTADSANIHVRGA